MIKVLINQHTDDGDIIMMKDEYKLVPEKEITDLKKEVKDLKKALMHKTIKTKESVSSKNLKKSMDNLSESISGLVNLFTVANDMGKHGAFNESKIQSSPELKSIIEQNKAIAKGILAITEILSENLPKLVNIAKASPKYKLLRIKQKSQSNSMFSEPRTYSRMPRSSESDSQSMQETDDDFEFPKEQDNNSQQG